ncbi:MAG: hypothetical protein JW984_03615 [Deltaproteobacteria bacterium]|uniref:Uncharacterized protein n=1 Tax=Candidatus Zymogenus saltonus TaxID=2844893 RepID=A0A9D8PJS7_9DELT|nr:hypothetical protein [Candidatus Zymogenus saltonus]
MRLIKSVLSAIFILFLVFIISALVAGTAAVVKMKSPPEPRPLMRVIIFTEIGNKIFEVEGRDTGGMDVEGLFTPGLIGKLKGAGYEVSMAVDDFDNPKFVSTIKRLNSAGVKVWVWPLHPMEDGYWLAADNADKFPALYGRFKKWVDENNLVIQGVMLDMEPTYADVQRLKEVVREGGMTGAVKYLLGRRDAKLNDGAKAIYADTIVKIREDGFEVSTFDYAYIIDDRLDGDSSIAQMFHIVSVDADFSVSMLYRSFFKDSGLGTGGANVLSYALALKSDGGNSAGIGSYMKDYLDVEDLKEDIRISARCSPVVHIYNLEALVGRGWLDEIEKVNIEEPIDISIASALTIFGYRTFFFLLDLFTGASRAYSLPVLFGLLIFLTVFFYRRRRG